DPRTLAPPVSIGQRHAGDASTAGGRARGGFCSVVFATDISMRHPQGGGSLPGHGMSLSGGGWKAVAPSAWPPGIDRAAGLPDE
ncbi:MAG: hypothetical protein ACYDCT_14345, partial [Dehalococcoidia bacterium]